MLVVSRRLKEKIVFPGMNASVQVVAIKSGSVRLGIDAPPEVAVLREELRDRPAGRGAEDRTGPPRRLRDRLKGTAVGLGLLELQLDAGLLSDARETLAAIREDLRALRLGAEGEREPPPAKPAAGSRKPPRARLVEDDGDLAREPGGSLCGV